MGDTIITAERLGKQYHIATRQDSYNTLFDTLSSIFVFPFRRARKLLRGQVTGITGLDEAFWALRDVSFEVKQGEVVGIIGRNGAGKSTLLKILSRITEPTEGYAEIRGRLGSLLEVGTGFHPELTGRENIYLNGTVLGMKKAEIDGRFDEIVAFSEIEKFLDTPVKHYSSGMYVRLAFAVAAHLDPEILIVDEVLAVGDTAFQKKCLGKMSEVSKGGRTVLFVSHNLAAVENLCTKGLVLEEGNLVFAGSPKHCLDHYLRSLAKGESHSDSSVVDLSNAPSRPQKFQPFLRRIELYTGDGRPLNGGIPMGASLKLQVQFHLESATTRFQLGVGFDTLRGDRIFTAHTYFHPNLPEDLSAGDHAFLCEIPSLTFVPGEYKIRLALALREGDVDVVEDAAHLTVVASDYYGTGKVPWDGKFVLKHEWRRC
jgi:lipopolysaccharide transport system ATP-binding protein